MLDALEAGPSEPAKPPSAPRPPKPASGGARRVKEPETGFVYLRDASQEARQARLAAWIKLRPSRVGPKGRKLLVPKVARVRHLPKHRGHLPTELLEVYRLNFTLIGMDIDQKESRQYAASDRTAHEKWMRLLDDYYTHVDDKVSSLRSRSPPPPC